MDHLKVAQENFQTAHVLWDDGHERSAAFETNLTIAAALIALVERLDRLSYQDGSDPERYRLRVNAD